MKQCNLSSYTDDTNIVYAHTEAERAINSDLAFVDKCYDLNGLNKRNNSKYQAIVIGKTQNKPTFTCKITIIPITPHLFPHLEILGVNIDYQLKFDNYDVSKVSTKVSQQIEVRYWIVLYCIELYCVVFTVPLAYIMPVVKFYLLKNPLSWSW